MSSFKYNFHIFTLLMLFLVGCTQPISYLEMDGLLLSKAVIEVNNYKKKHATTSIEEQNTDLTSLLIRIDIKNNKNIIVPIVCSQYKSITKLHRALQIDPPNRKYYYHFYLTECHTCSSYAIADTLYPQMNKPFYIRLYNFPDTSCGDLIYLENTLIYDERKESNFVVFLDMDANKSSFTNKSIESLIKEYKEKGYKEKDIEGSIKN